MKRIAYELILPTDPDRASRITAVPGAKRHWWQRRRWLPAFDLDLLLEIAERQLPGAQVRIIPGGPEIPGGAYMHVNDTGARRVYEIGLDMTMSPANLSKALYHELTHCVQSTLFATGAAFHTVAHWAAVEGALSGLGSWYEERAADAEDLHYELPLVRRVRETR